MLGNNRLVQGLFFGVICCTITPLTKSYFFSGGNSNISQKTSQEGEKVAIPKRDTFLKILLAGNNLTDGLVAEMTREKDEDSQGKLSKVTGKGEDWNKSGTLYSENSDGGYTFTDKSGVNVRPPCYGIEKKWKNLTACFVRTKVDSKYENIWKHQFPKIKFEGGVAHYGNRGYSEKLTPYMLSGCSVNVTENKLLEGFDLTATISCQDSSLVKRLNVSNLGGTVLEIR